jgi:hypothetical protein
MQTDGAEALFPLSDCSLPLAASDDDGGFSMFAPPI